MFALPEPIDAVVRGGLLGLAALALIILLVRIIGLRSFSKMTAFDFVITLATGSLLASAGTISTWTAFLQVLVAIVTLMGFQVALAQWRQRSRGVNNAVENEPLALMRDGQFLEGAMAKSRVSADDVRAKLRMANVRSLDEVRLVVLETTSDISIIHGERLDDRLVSDVR